MGGVVGLAEEGIGVGFFVGCFETGIVECCLLGLTVDGANVGCFVEWSEEGSFEGFAVGCLVAGIGEGWMVDFLLSTMSMPELS